MIEHETAGQKPVRKAEVLDVTAQGVLVKGQLKGAHALVDFEKVATVYERTTLERGPGEVLLLTQKIKARGQGYDDGSRQTVPTIQGEKGRFVSCLQLRCCDSR